MQWHVLDRGDAPSVQGCADRDGMTDSRDTDSSPADLMREVNRMRQIRPRSC
jgi:hypothetical protein